MKDWSKSKQLMFSPWFGLVFKMLDPIIDIIIIFKLWKIPSKDREDYTIRNQAEKIFHHKYKLVASSLNRT